MTKKIEQLAEIGYNTYKVTTNSIYLPRWENISPTEKQAWISSAMMIQQAIEQSDPMRELAAASWDFYLDEKDKILGTRTGTHWRDMTEPMRQVYIKTVQWILDHADLIIK